ncbi:protein phosphatase 2C domain-containing protein [Streptacidiphilus cavernicola]|uniref:Protein phosphatase 2C domain-containing protein n=1 Tax=Streptacidiphilus cavernicola TaxID=3342716 RepID=A0ABV6VUS8_9ACTN
MQVSYVCRAGPDTAVNEDFVLASERFVVVLDGATASGLPTGCVHDVAWLVGRLGGQLAALLIERPELALPETLRQGIVNTRALHGGCDLTNPDSPSSTVALVREREGVLDCLVLADSPVVLETTAGEIVEVSDDRVARLPACDRVALSRLRNSDQGFWVAGSRPEAADRAVVLSLPAAEVRRFAVVTDGVSRLVERYGWSWLRLLDALEQEGPDSVVRAVRAAEHATAPGAYRGKRHDDVTAVFGLVR